MQLVKRKLEYQVEKSKVAMEKLKRHFTDCLPGFPISVKAVNKPIQVKTLRQRDLVDKLFEMEEVIERKIIEAEIRGRCEFRLLFLQFYIRWLSNPDKWYIT